MNISDMRIIVTGAASGMGRHFALRLAEEGAWVMGADVAADKLESLKAEAIGMAGRIEAIRADVTSEQDVAATVNATVERFGCVNGLINNAGLFRDALLVKKDKTTGQLCTMSLADWKLVLEVDLTGPFLCARAVAAKMIEMGTSPGVIINISSVSRHGNIGQSNYSAAKAGLVADTRLWAKELARYGIRTAAIAPGFIQTPLLEGMPKEVLDKIISNIPLQRLGTAEEIYLGVRFVIECDYFSGKCLDIDGGQVL